MVEDPSSFIPHLSSLIKGVQDLSSGQIDILLVEDEPAHARLASRAFAADAGAYRLAVASTLAAARASIARCPPSLVITDLVLPDGRGTELIPSEGGSAAPPVVVMTSQGDEQVAVEAIKRGALDYIVKSDLSFAEMPRIADRALRQWRLIVERNRAQAALRESEERFRQMAENSQQIFWLAKADLSEMLYVSPSYETVTGRSCASLYANPTAWWELLSPEDRAAVLARAQRRIAQRAAVRTETEYRIVRPDGIRRWLRVLVFSVLDEHGAPYRLAGIAEDITERKTALEQLHERETQLAHVARLTTMGELVAGIAHEVNQPLYAISNYARACANALGNEGPPPLEKLRRWNEDIQAAATRASEIIKRLSNFTRRGECLREHVDVNQTIEQSLELLAFDARRCGVTVERKLCLPAPRVPADEIQLQQVLVNLLRNAYEAVSQHNGASNGRIVRVTTTTAGDFAEIAVADSGPGLPPDGERLFDAFVTTKPTGMGMGLAVSRSIVEAHGGAIKAANNPGGGATFSFTIPLAHEGRTHG
jgi:PAS domain S-box-containing protein